MNGLRKRGGMLFVLILAAGIQACVPGNQIITRAAVPDEVNDTYTLMLYGCHYSDEIDNVGILVAGNSKYPVEIYDLDTSYRMKKDVPGRQALAEADSFVRCSTHRVWQTQLRRIPDDSGGTIGYEVRPLYIPYEFGVPDVLRITYSLRNGVVRVMIKVDPDIERAIEASGGDKGTSDSK